MEMRILLAQAAAVLSVVENYQWELGRIANDVMNFGGYKELRDFSKKIEEETGVKRSASSLRIYAYVWRESNRLGLPKKYMFSNCREIIFTGNAEKYAEMVKAGKTKHEVKKEISKDKKG
jgi:hypothetical protein